MLELKAVQSFQDLKPNQIVLFIDKDNRVRGMDKIIEFNNGELTYSYLNSEGKVFQGNWTRFFNYGWRAYLVDERIFNYSDEKLKSSLLDIEGFFENLYGQKVGYTLYTKVLELVSSSFEKRMIFIDFCKSNKEWIFTVKWEGDEEVTQDQRVIDFVKEELQKELNKVELFD